MKEWRTASGIHTGRPVHALEEGLNPGISFLSCKMHYHCSQVTAQAEPGQEERVKSGSDEEIRKVW